MKQLNQHFYLNTYVPTEINSSNNATFNCSLQSSVSNHHSATLAPAWSSARPWCPVPRTRSSCWQLAASRWRSVSAPTCGCEAAAYSARPRTTAGTDARRSLLPRCARLRGSLYIWDVQDFWLGCSHFQDQGWLAVESARVSSAWWRVPFVLCAARWGPLPPARLTRSLCRLRFCWIRKKFFFKVSTERFIFI